MSVVWSGTWFALNTAAAFFAVLVFAVLIVARQRLVRAVRPAVVGGTSSAPVAGLPERFRTLAPAADELIDAVAVTRRSPFASPPGMHPPLPAGPRPAHGPLPGLDAPDPRTQYTVATATMIPAQSAQLLR